MILGQLQGFIRSGPRETLVNAHAVLFHRHGSASPTTRQTPRRTVLLLGEGVSIGFDQNASQTLTWSTIDGVSFSTESAKLSVNDRGVYELDFSPAADVVVRFFPRQPRLTSNLWEHFSTAEQIGVWPVMASPHRQVVGAQGKIRLGSQTRKLRGVIISTDYHLP